MRPRRRGAGGINTSGRSGRPVSNCSCSWTSGCNGRGAYQAVRHLIDHGHRRISYLGDRDDIWAVRERCAGFTEAFATDGLVPDPGLVRHGLRSRVEAARAAEYLMRLPSPPTALFTSNDLVTMGAVDALYSSRAHRGTVALVGFDEFALADKLTPPVTVAAQDPATIGSTAAQPPA